MIWYTWFELDRDIGLITKWAKIRGFTHVYGIPDGGVIPAVVLSHRMGRIPVINTEPYVNIERYITAKTLVIDDIAHNGNTLLCFDARFVTSGFIPTIVTLFYRKGTKRMPDFWLHEATDFVKFPWETKESSKIDYLS